MINIAELTKKDIGRWVLYEGHAGEEEKGRIKSWNDKYIFVVYKCNHEWDRFQDFTGAATNPIQLRFTTKGELFKKVEKELQEFDETEEAKRQDGGE